MAPGTGDIRTFVFFNKHLSKAIECIFLDVYLRNIENQSKYEFGHNAETWDILKITQIREICFYMSVPENALFPE